MIGSVKFNTFYTWNLSHSVSKECRKGIITIVTVQLWDSLVNVEFVRLGKCSHQFNFSFCKFRSRSFFKVEREVNNEVLCLLLLILFDV